ncbi:glutaredoxin family protein [Paraferrimonas sedimenticola]|uniref:Thioredoxin family protein n=1 Tax=Paraferrimonas sedimenticola TaxID=375674 RepID=A0AA37RUV1_9GAMM|nr:glutaredoxin family protein [Paraferrimonas sedimenticola]GLP96005.1 thioredoxin family protein [Paraferrimonas sedimenticola]
MTDLRLFHTEGCHLCELAQALLDEQQLSYQLVDICDHAESLEKYKIRIPVLTKGDAELGWPFDQASLTEFLEANQ